MTERGRFTTKDLMSVTDLNYRTITDWDFKGIIPAHRDADKGWRRFTVEDMFVTLVCTEIRNQFGVPISSLRWLKDRMFEDKNGYLTKALWLMESFGTPVFILTDLRTYFRMCSTIEMVDANLNGFFDDDEKKGFVLLKVNPLVNKLLNALGVEAPPNHGLGYEILWSILSRGISEGQSPKEQEILEMVRDKAHTRIDIKLENGTIVQASVEKRLRSISPEELINALNSEDNTTLTIVKHQGHIVAATQKLPKKADRVHKRGVSRRRNNPSLG